MIYVRGGRAVRVRQGRRCAPIMINAPPSVLQTSRRMARSVSFAPAPLVLFSHCSPTALPHRSAGLRSVFVGLAAAVALLAPPPPASASMLDCRSPWGAAVGVGHGYRDGSPAARLWGCRTGAVILEPSVSSLSLPAAAGSQRRRRWREVEGRQLEKDGRRKGGSGEGNKWIERDARKTRDRGRLRRRDKYALLASHLIHAT